MKLHAKIKPEYLDQILTGDKSMEVRSLESITLTDGTRTHTFDIEDAETRSPVFWSRAFPQMFDKNHPVIALYIGKELKTDVI